MQRNFYLLCLVIYINGCFCYDHIYNRGLKVRHLGRRLKKKEDSSNEDCNVKDSHVIKRRQNYGANNENDFAQIDVASFIQKPDFYAEEELLSEDGLQSQLMPKYNDYDILNNLNSQNIKEDHFNNDENKKLKASHDSALKDMTYSNDHNLEDISLNSKNNDYQYNDFKSVFENEISADNSVHNPLKKSAMQHLSKLKFPFFSRRKNNSSKLNNINTTRKQQYFIDINDNTGYKINNYWSQKDIKKRADKDNSCLKCRNAKTNSKNEKRGLGKSIIHNSRQYYQRFRSDNKNKKVSKEPIAESVNINKATVKNKALSKQSTETHKKDDKKSFIGRQKKANHKHKEKETKKKKKISNRKE